MAGAHPFQLVATIPRVEIGRCIQATTIWNGTGGLRPAGFLLEAVAQAAGWLIAASTDFARRGLPLSIATVRLLADPPPGARVDLLAEVTAWRDASAVLRGEASWGGRPLGEAEGGICGLVDATQLEDPTVTRATFEALLAAPPDAPGSGTPAEPPGVPSVQALDARGGRATWLVAGGQDLFADHFPRLPLLPGSLQVQALVGLAQAVAGAEGGAADPVASLHHVQFRRPVRPGERLVLEAEMIRHSARGAILTARAVINGERAAALAEVHIGPTA